MRKRAATDLYRWQQNGKRSRIRIAIYRSGQNIKTLQYKLNKNCTNNQAEQLAILKALEYVENTQTVDKKATI